MKIILVLIICSAVNGLCEKGWKKNVEFSDWDSCMRQGYMDSLQLMDVMGSDYVNENETFIKFYCKEIKIEEMSL